MALAKMKKYKCFVSYLILGVLKLKKNMIVGKILKFATKPEQPGLSSSIRLEVMKEQT